MLDLRLIRRDPEAVRTALARRGDVDPTAIDALLAADERWRELTTQLETLQAEQNEATRPHRRCAESHQLIDGYSERRDQQNGTDVHVARICSRLDPEADTLDTDPEEGQHRGDRQRHHEIVRNPVSVTPQQHGECGDHRDPHERGHSGETLEDRRQAAVHKRRNLRVRRSG